MLLMKILRFFGFILVLLASWTACQRSYDGPPQTDAPAPPPLKGAYVCGYGAVIFNGDGVSMAMRLTPELARAIDMPAGDSYGTYAFLFHNEQIRYDQAEYLKLTVGERSYRFIVGPGRVTPERITVSWPFEGRGPDIVFEHQPQ